MGSRKAEFCSQHAGDGMVNVRYTESKRSATCRFEEPATRPKRVKVEIAAKESNDGGGCFQRSRSRELWQPQQAKPSKSSTTGRAKGARITGGVVPAHVVRSMTTAHVVVLEGGTRVKSEMSMSQIPTSNLTATHLVATSHD